MHAISRVERIHTEVVRLERLQREAESWLWAAAERRGAVVEDIRQAARLLAQAAQIIADAGENG